MSTAGTREMPPIEMLTDRRLSPTELAELQEHARAKRARVVITGIGAITPLGKTPDEFWRSLLAGKSGIGPVTLFDTANYKTRIAGEVKDFDVTQYGVDAKDARRMGRATLFALAAGHDALRDADFKNGLQENDRAGVLLGTALGGLVEAIEAHNGFLQKGPDRVSPFLADLGEVRRQGQQLFDRSAEPDRLVLFEEDAPVAVRYRDQRATETSLGSCLGRAML